MQQAANGAQSPLQSPSHQQQVAHRDAQAQRARAVDPSAAVGMAIGHINAGQIDAALRLLDSAINGAQEPNMGALIARGTARALKRELKGVPKLLLEP